MTQYIIGSALAVLAAAMIIAMRDGTIAKMSARAVSASVLAGAGTGIAIFAADGFGWGWPDLTTSRALMLQILGGLGIGLANTAALWMLTGHLRAGWAVIVIVANALILVIPPQLNLVRLLVFASLNFLLALGWTRSSFLGPSKGADLTPR